MSNIETSRNVVIICSSLSDNNIFNRNIDGINFLPDAVILNRIVYFNDGVPTSDELMILRSDICGDFIAPFTEMWGTSPINVEYKLYGKPIMGSYQFQVLDASLSTVLNVPGKIGIHLTFVKYK